MTDNTTPFFIRPHRFDDPEQDDSDFPYLDWHGRIALDEGELLLWRDLVDVAGYLAEPNSGDCELSWRLTRPALVLVTDRRLAYACADWDVPKAGADAARPFSGARHRRRLTGVGSRLVTGQIRWQWPSGLRFLPADPMAAGRTGQPERLLIVCDALRTTDQPGLALSGGPLDSPSAIRRLLQLVRRTIAGFRLTSPDTVDLSLPERDALQSQAGARLFASELADPRRGVHLPGALPIEFLSSCDYYRRRSPWPAWRQPGADVAGRWSAGKPGSAG